jgi:hypothetical protein
MGDLLDCTRESIKAAVGDGTLDAAVSAGPIEALQILALKIDTEDALRELALAWADEHETRPPSVDNVSIPTYLKYCAELRLTPASRLDLKKEPAHGSLAKLRSVKADSAG